MATSVVESAASNDVAFSGQYLDHLPSNELCRGATLSTGTQPKFSYASSNDAFLSFQEIEGPSHKFEFSHQEIQKAANDNFRCTRSEDAKNNPYKDQTSGSNSSRPDTLNHEKNFNGDAFHMKTGMDFTESPGARHFAPIQRSGTSICEKNTDKKWNYSKDNSNFSGDLTNYNLETNAPKSGQFSSTNLRSHEYSSNSQNFNFESIKTSYNFDQKNNTTKFDSSNGKDTSGLNVPTRKYTESGNEDIALKLRSNFHSDFLSNEFQTEQVNKPEEFKIEFSETFRTIDEILKEYGLSDNSFCQSTKPADTTGNKYVASLQTGLPNNPLKDDISSNLNKTVNSVTSTLNMSSKDKNSGNSFSVLSSKNINNTYRTDRMSNSLNVDSKNSATSMFPINISQNNETGSSSQNIAENELLRKSGSSVDYSSAGRMGLYNRGSNYRGFDYGKAPSLSIDSSRVSTYPGFETKQFEGNIDRIKYEGSQVDTGKTSFNINKSTPVEIIRTMGSVTDTLEYSMSSERQRLRKLDTMISATPFNYSAFEIPKSLKSQALSPERNFGALRSNDLTGRGIYSTTNIPSSSGHGAGISHRNPHLRSSGHRDTSIPLNKSISAPGTAERHFQTSSTYDTSVDPSVPYRPYGGTVGYNYQYNNAYNSHVLNKLSNQRPDPKAQKKPVPCKKGECSLKNKKGDNSYNEHQSSYQRPSSGIDFLRTSHSDKNSIAGEKKRYGGKQEVKKMGAGKKYSGYDVNQSKNVGNIIDGFDFVKDLNRMWKDVVFGAASSNAMLSQNKKQGKYTPYKPTAMKDDKKEKTSDGQCKRENGGKNVHSMLSKSECNWDVPNSLRNFDGYETDVGLQSAHKMFPQSSLEPHRSAQPRTMASTTSLVKQKSKISSGLTKKQYTTPAPKSILKQSSVKSACSSHSEIRPHSAMSSKSYIQPNYKMPYQLVRGFSPVDTSKTARSSMSSAFPTTKKVVSSVKSKPATRPSKTALRK